MALSKKKRKTLAYWILLTVYALVLAVAIFYVWSIAKEYSIEYENSQSSTVVDSFISNLNDIRWNDKMDAAARKISNEFQNEEECVALVKESLVGPIQCSKILNPDFSRLQYRIVCNEREIGQASFIENKAEEKNVRFGMLPWIIENEQYNFDYMINGSATCTVPAGYTVMLNGVAVSDNYITETGIPYDVLKEYYSEYSGLPTKVRYDVSGLVGNIEPVVYDENGNEFAIDLNANDSQFLEPCPETEISRLRDFAYAFIEPYAKFTGTKNFDATYPALKQYVKPGSDLDNRMQQFYAGGSDWVHWISCIVSDISFNGAYSLGGDFYVIDVSYVTTNYHEYKDPVQEENVKRIVVLDNGQDVLAVSVE